MLHRRLGAIGDIIDIYFWTIYLSAMDLGISKVLGPRNILALISLLLLWHCRAALAGGYAADHWYLYRSLRSLRRERGGRERLERLVVCLYRMRKLLFILKLH